jgi:glycosyltransferase involved in cell wall biosynthesis
MFPLPIELVNIYIISSVLPEPTTGGGMLLHRHFSPFLQENETEWECHFFGQRYFSGKPDLLWNGFFSRLQHSRFAKYANDFSAICCRTHLNFETASIERPLKGELVVTVAHGELFETAWRFAESRRLPLITFFHDWWPDIPKVHTPFRWILKRKFQNLYKRSNVALCVSEGMKKALGPHPSSHVLYPIPDAPRKLFSQVCRPKANFIIKYFGNLFEYGPMLGNALKEFQKQDFVRLEVRGANPQWPEFFKLEMFEKDLWKDFAPRNELGDWLAEADAFLIPMVFEAGMRQRMQTSFPSKLVEFAQFGKPLIVWGPSDCSAIDWAGNSIKALCVTEESTTALLDRIMSLFKNPQEQSRLAAEARKASESEFNPQRIQQQFLDLLDIAAKCEHSE